MPQAFQVRMSPLRTSHEKGDKCFILLGNDTDELRIYVMGAQILSELGLKDMILLSYSEWKFIGLEAYGINIIETKLLSDL